MAAKEVIHFPLLVQLSPRCCIAILSPPEPVAEPPPLVKTGRILSPRNSNTDRPAILVSRQLAECRSSAAKDRRGQEQDPGQLPLEQE
jgi:hypothetical protein